MVAYSFKPMFIDPILAGTKGGTIRAVGKRRHANIGDALQLYTGMRTPHCALIVRTICSDRCGIKLDFRRKKITTGGAQYVLAGSLDNIARLDGFDDFEAMRAFWRDVHDTHRFEGVWIRWVRPVARVAMGSEVGVGVA